MSAHTVFLLLHTLGGGTCEPLVLKGKGQHVTSQKAWKSLDIAASHLAYKHSRLETSALLSTACRTGGGGSQAGQPRRDAVRRAAGSGGGGAGRRSAPAAPDHGRCEAGGAASAWLGALAAALWPQGVLLGRTLCGIVMSVTATVENVL